MRLSGASLLPPSEDGISILTPEMVRRAPIQVKQVINQIGRDSSTAQGLKTIITTSESFTLNQKLYILNEKTYVYGFCKIGPRKLFFWDPYGNQREFDLICLLDFFVYPDSQRKGFGKKIIDRMLKDEGLQMHRIPIDRPSIHCLNFMRKHFGLEDYTAQSNNFVVFRQFWESNFNHQKSESKVTSKMLFNSTFTPIGPAGRGVRGRRGSVNPITWLPYE